MFLEVAVPVPKLGLLTYALPESVPAPAIGARVMVPLGRRTTAGIVVGVAPEPPRDVKTADIKTIERIIDAGAFLPPAVIELARWTAEYYVAGLGETLAATLPPHTRGGRADAHKKIRLASITVAGLEALRADTLKAKQTAMLSLLASAAHGMPTAELASRGFSAELAARLVKRGLVSLRFERVDRDPFGDSRFLSAEPIGELTPEQAASLLRLEALAGARQFGVALVHGVTGSGKTEIYRRLAVTVRNHGRGVLMLVPEIALTPVVSALFHRTFGSRVAVQHSGLSDGERHDQWQRIRRGDVDVVIGTRSAVFAPLENVGLVIVDEEHDSSYKQEESPRYNGRDVAIIRAQQAGCLVVLGSATPSMESYHNAVSGRFNLVVLTRRVLDRPLAAVDVVDMRAEYAAGGPDVVLSSALKEAIRLRLERREQSLVLLNRRGFATAVFCRQCAGTLDCPNCSVSLVVHGTGASRRTRCHYCNYSTRIPTACPNCKAPYLEHAGFGTERVEAEVRLAWPDARVARLDRDSIRRKGAVSALLSKLRDGTIDVLVGTQMIAKGHDFPGVTLVGVVSADVGLGVADFRASERTFQLLTQVAGRAGRGERPGQAIIQTINPHHYSIELACRQDYPSFYEKELGFRRAMRYPPRTALVNLVVRGRTFGRAMEEGTDLAEALRRQAKESYVVLGPAPPPLGKLRGEYRVQILMKGPNRRMMREAIVDILKERPTIARNAIVDVDPLSVS